MRKSLSKNKDIAKQSLRRLKITGVALLVVFGPLLLVYSWLAVRPTGYGELQERMPENLAAMERRLDATSVGVHQKAQEVPVASEESGTSESADLMSLISSRGIIVEIDVPRGQYSNFPYVLRTVVDGQWKWFGRMDTGWFEKAGEPDPKAAISADRTEEILEQARRNPQWNRAHEVETSATKQPSPGRKEREWMTENIDRVERVLLNLPVKSGASPFYGDYVFLNFEELARFGHLAIVRAAERGETARAEALFFNLLEACQRIRLSTFPATVSDMPHPMIALIMMAARIDAFPDAALQRADELLAAYRISETEAAQFREIYAKRIADAYLINADHDFVDSANDTFNLFMDGVPQRTWRRAMLPALRNNVERLAVAWAGEDARAWEKAEREHLGLIKFLNIKYPGALGTFYRHVSFGESYNSEQAAANRTKMLRQMTGKDFNGEVDLTRLVLATERYRRAKGEYPRNIEGLAPEFLAAGALERGESRPMIWWLDGFRRPMFQSHVAARQGKYAPIEFAIDRYAGEREGALPKSAEDLTPFLANETERTLAVDLFHDVEARPVFCIVEPDTERINGKAQSVVRVRGVVPMYPSMPEWLKEWAAGEE